MHNCTAKEKKIGIWYMCQVFKALTKESSCDNLIKTWPKLKLAAVTCDNDLFLAALALKPWKPFTGNATKSLKNLRTH